MLCLPMFSCPQFGRMGFPKGSEGLDEVDGGSEGTIYVDFRLGNIQEIMNV